MGGRPRQVSAPVAGVGATLIAAVGMIAGSAAEYASIRAGSSFVELSKATGEHIAALNEQIDELQSDKQIILDNNARVREEREELRRELEHAERLLQLERGARLNPSGIAAPANPPPP